MLKSILNALVSGLKASARLLGSVLTAPLRMFGRGGDAGAPPKIPMPQPYEAPPEDRTKMYEDIARAIMCWAADSVLADRPVDLPPGLPLTVREWLPGLSRAECWSLMDADNNVVCGHIQGLFPLAGVRAVQRLPRVRAWPAELRTPESAGFAAIAELEMLGQPGA
ncbi:hypothetical protein [Bradyrhizobium diazoefficiens]|uniref:hypothetical protein n=1 Tax=Bradyrhizobium diazoefficiens TaxID=1355477 RepID=UPI0004AC666F|nr:hypothetical protein [Bradyrhizobium diazoefficiens]